MNYQLIIFSNSKLNYFRNSLPVNNLPISYFKHFKKNFVGALKRFNLGFFAIGLVLFRIIVQLATPTNMRPKCNDDCRLSCESNPRDWAIIFKRLRVRTTLGFAGKLRKSFRKPRDVRHFFSFLFSVVDTQQGRRKVCNSGG